MNRISAECGVRSAEYKIHDTLRCTLTSHVALRTPHSKGFTLIEVLLALAIFAGVATVLYSVFATTGSTVAQAEQVRDGTDAARTLMSRIATDVANAFYYAKTIEPTFFYGRKVEEDGGADRKIRLDSLFLTTLTNWRRPDTREMELWELGYYFKDRPDGKGRALVRREKRELSADVPPLEGGVEYEITDQIASLRFRYFNGSAWIDEWDSKNQNALPKAVEIVLVMAAGGVYATSVEIGIK
ncbi:MAG: prepilin-type N-terminal cleavage/methylation domain-containing protein [Nitrospirota bacterium]|nr:prepilin-type N-terminal cleavage/methylation domain-containing protein [Nitrospirota bacterium]